MVSDPPLVNHLQDRVKAWELVIAALEEIASQVSVSLSQALLDDWRVDVLVVLHDEAHCVCLLGHGTDLRVSGAQIAEHNIALDCLIEEQWLLLYDRDLVPQVGN